MVAAERASHILAVLETHPMENVPAQYSNSEAVVFYATSAVFGEVSSGVCGIGAVLDRRVVGLQADRTV